MDTELCAWNSISIPYAAVPSLLCLFLVLTDPCVLQMMECGQCKCWVHAKCEGLSDEKYQVLSYLPESVEFVCRLVVVLFFMSKKWISLNVVAAVTCS